MPDRGPKAVSFPVKHRRICCRRSRRLPGRGQSPNGLRGGPQTIFGGTPKQHNIPPSDPSRDSAPSRRPGLHRPSKPGTWVLVSCETRRGLTRIGAPLPDHHHRTFHRSDGPAVTASERISRAPDDERGGEHLRVGPRSRLTPDVQSVSRETACRHWRDGGAADTPVCSFTHPSVVDQRRHRQTRRRVHPQISGRLTQRPLRPTVTPQPADPRQLTRADPDPPQARVAHAPADL
ncbi:hypothetical protein NONI108955_23905 [Nocardia ninae]